jgi:hypothetical protein
VRKVVAIALALAVQGGALTAPLVHAHPDEHATDHHAAGTVHTHWAGHTHSSQPSDIPAFDTADPDRAVFLNAFVAVATTVFSAPAAALTAFALPVAAERAAHRRVEIVRSHDPPCIRSLCSRAPPAFLS